MTLFTVTTNADSGPGSLRAQILLADQDNTIGADTIDFKIGNGGTQTIALQSALPTITRSVAIDGTTQAVSATTPNSGVPTIVIDGTNAGGGANGLVLTGTQGGSTIRGLSIVNFNSASTTGGGRGILVNDGGGDTFEGNYLGVGPDGTIAQPNVVGIEIRTAGNVVGSSTSTSAATPGRNLISGNSSSGVLITGTGATGNQVVGNRIGTDITGETAVGNLYGVTIAGASNNTIGGATTAAGNLISGNAGPQQITGVGVNITGVASNNVISGNEIGTNAEGTRFVYNTFGIYLGTVGGSTADLVKMTTIGSVTAGGGNLISGNGIGITGNTQSSLIAGNLIGTDITGQTSIGNGSGIYLGAIGTTIGGTTAAARNIISGSGTISSGGTGLQLSGDTDTVVGNYIGTNIDGTRALPNSQGMVIQSTHTTVGGTAAGAGNIVSGNTLDGIILNSTGSDTLQGNLIGASATGAALGNGGNGISIIPPIPTNVTPSTTVALGDLIGGTATGAANTITANNGAGVAVIPNGVTYTGVSIRGNRLSANGGLGISLTGAVNTPLPETLALTSIAATATNTTVQGVLGGLPGATYQVDVYSNSAADPTGYGEGQTYLGTLQVVIGSGGLTTFSGTLPTPVAAGTVLTATATSLLGSTSEFSAAFPNTLPAADLAITQTVSASTVATNGIVTLTAKVTNNGTSTAQNVVFTDALPLSLANAVITTSVGTASRTGDNIALVQLGNLAPGASATITISANATASGTITNTAGVLGTTPDASYTNNTASESFTVGAASTPSADLGVRVTPSSTAPAVGSNLTYTVTVTNAGPTAATNVLVSDFLPANATLVSATPSQGAAATVTGTLVSSNLGTIAAGASATFVITVNPTAAGSLVDSANVASNLLDPVPANNSASSTLTVGGSTGTTGSPLLTLTQTVAPVASANGQYQVFSIVVRNIGTAAASGVVLIDSLPSGTTYVAAAANQGSASTVANGVVTTNLGTIAAGASAGFTIVVLPGSAAAGQTNYIGAIAANTTAPVFSRVPLTGNTAAAAAGPSVLSVVGARSNAQLVVKFNEAITAASATTRSNYLLYDLGLTPRALTSSDKPIAITTAVYNAANTSVTLTPSRAIRANQYYALVVVGTTRTGITDTTGRKLVGNSGGTAGTNYGTTFLASNLTQV